MNPLTQEYIHLNELAEFLGVSVRWLKRKAAEGLIRLHPVGKSTLLAKVSEVMASIDNDMLSPGANHEVPGTSQKRNPKNNFRRWNDQVGSKGEGKRRRTLQEIRSAKASSALD